ncbi:cobalt-precorrin-6A reductase [Tessaracoccus antarcticus]|uniref:Cobalt-precorrin-6A reductase n=1 Tax=Tessaracoccus antarcticus TaxID=2479848 RepID=A0A3M0GKF6_9ACTN|nr:cobalt-precorrin-6A reductase [Tessaracoccus antarcticus]RMB61629.1 cobalt-precorrin-6A reductase [Tessaracoccus antarcticus]
MGVVILVLGGTAEGRAVAQVLVDRGVPAVLSLAGRTSTPLTAGPVRSGGFGGVDGLAAYLLDGRVSAVVDATHPFAESMSRNAEQACSRLGVPLVRLARPGWFDHPLADTWHWVGDHSEAARAAHGLGGAVLLTVGRQHTLDYVTQLGECTVVARVAEPPPGLLPPRWLLLCARGPFTLAGERELLRRHAVTVLVTKDSGGEHTEAKLHAAAEQGVAVVVIRRPPPLEGVTRVSTVDEAVDWLSRGLRGGV